MPNDSPASFTLKEQAAIALRLPNSGTQWLDMMIAQARRHDMAMEMFQAFCESQKLNETNVAIMRKNGLDAWLRTNGNDLPEVLAMCEAMARTQRPKAQAPAAAPAPTTTIQTNGALTLEPPRG